MAAHHDGTHPLNPDAWSQGLQDFVGDWRNDGQFDIWIGVEATANPDQVLVTYRNLPELGDGSHTGAFNATLGRIEISDGAQSLFNLVPDGTEGPLRALRRVPTTQQAPKEIERFVEEEGGGELPRGNG